MKLAMCHRNIDVFRDYSDKYQEGKAKCRERKAMSTEILEKREFEYNRALTYVRTTNVIVYIFSTLECNS